MEILLFEDGVKAHIDPKTQLVAFAEHQFSLKVPQTTGSVNISQTGHAWSRHHLTTIARSVLTGAANQTPDWQHLWYQRLKTRMDSRISCLAWALKIFHGCNPHTQLSSAMRFITKKHYNSIEIINQI